MHGVTAEFVGYQLDERLGGARAFYVINAPGFERHLSTVFATTLVELGIPIPAHPPYTPKTSREKFWIYKCNKCHISYAAKQKLIEHAKRFRHSDLSMEEITVADGLPLGPVKEKQKPVFLKKEEKKEEPILSKQDLTSHVQTKQDLTEEDTQPLDMEEILKENHSVEDWKESMFKQYPFLRKAGQ